MAEPEPMRLRRWDYTDTGVEITTTRPPKLSPDDMTKMHGGVGLLTAYLAGAVPSVPELAELKRRIGAFRILCEESNETDTGAAWELLDDIEDALRGLS